MNQVYKRENILLTIKGKIRAEHLPQLCKLMDKIEMFFSYLEYSSNTDLNEIYYYVFVEERYYSYLDISIELNKYDPPAICRKVKKINKIIKNIILNEPEFSSLIEYI